MKSSLLRKVTAFACAALAACASAPESGKPEGAAFEKRALEIAGEYEAWGRVDDLARWAPELCMAPPRPRAYPSASEDEATHGKKLYSVFVKHREAYPEGTTTDQVVVKEAWRSERVTSAPAEIEQGGFYPYARDGEAVYHAAERAGLYIMFQVDPATPGTDEGWVYATVAKDGVVKAAGRIASCVACHEAAPHGRLFGVPKSPTTGAR